ncbi:MAG: ROK family protein, partial [Leifsonia sp.]
IERQLGFLAVALRNASNVFNPELVVLGGVLGSLFAVAPDRLGGLVAEQAMAASGEHLRIARAELGANILMIGAAELAFAPLLAAPAD